MPSRITDARIRQLVSPAAGSIPKIDAQNVIELLVAVADRPGKTAAAVRAELLKPGLSDDQKVELARAGMTASEAADLRVILSGTGFDLAPGARSMLERLVGTTPVAPTPGLPAPSPVNATVSVSPSRAQQLTFFYRAVVTAPDVVPQAAVDALAARLGPGLNGPLVETWLQREPERNPPLDTGTLRSQLLVASLRHAMPAEFQRLSSTPGGLAQAVVVDPVTGEARVPRALNEFFEQYGLPFDQGVDVASEAAKSAGGGFSSPSYDLEVTGAGGSAKAEIKLKSAAASPQPRWELSLDNGTLMVRRLDRSDPAVPASTLNSRSLNELSQPLAYGGRPVEELLKQLNAARGVAGLRTSSASDAALTALSSGLRALLPTPVAPTRPSRGLPGPAAVDWEMKRAVADSRLTRDEVLHLVGAATAKPGAAVLPEVVKQLQGIDESQAHYMGAENPLLLGSTVPYLALGVSDARVSSAFPVTTPRVPAEGTPISLVQLRSLLASAGLAHVRPEALMYVLHQREVAFANNKVMEQLGTQRLPVEWGYRDAWVATKGIHPFDGERDTNASPAMQAREVDYAYLMGSNNFARAQYDENHLEASLAGELMPQVPGFKKLTPMIQLLQGTVPSPPPGVWATALNPMTYAGRRLVQVSALLDRIEASGPIDTPQGKVTKASVLASFPEVMRAYNPRSRPGRFGALGRVRTDQYDALRARKGVFEQTVELQKKMRAAATPAEADALRNAAPPEVVTALWNLPFGNFENEIDRYCTYGGPDQGYGQNETGTATDPRLNHLGTAQLDSLGLPWDDVSYEYTINTLARRGEYPQHFRRPIADAWSENRIGAPPLDHNAGLPLVSTNASTGEVARRGRDSFFLVDGHAYLGDTRLVPPEDPLLDRTKVIVAGAYLVFALDDPDELASRGGTWTRTPEVKRRIDRGTLLYNVETGSWSKQGLFNVAEFTSGVRLEPARPNRQARLVAVNGGYGDEIVLP